MISVLVLCKNEEHDLPRCLQSVQWSDDILVFDSFSTDRTVEIAKAHGARVIQRIFDNYAAQRNAALHEQPFRHEWLLLVDADEEIPAQLAEEMRQRLSRTNEKPAAFRIRRRDFFMGTWLKHAQISPFYVRLVRPDKVHYERAINEVLKVDGEVEELQEPFDHFPFSKGLRHWIDKHNLYSTMEAVEAQRVRQASKGDFSLRTALFGQDFNVRRFHQKGLFYQVPCRPLLKLAYMTVVRRAFLDGTAGITYSVLQSIYEYFIVLKTRELESTQK